MSSPAVATDAVIEHVYFAQTHVMEPQHPYFRLIGNRDALIKVHVLSPSGADAPPVEVELAVGKERRTLTLEGPATLATSFDTSPATIEHRFDDCFTAMIPAKWLRRGLVVTITAGDQRRVLDDLPIGAPTHLKVTLFDIHYFDYEDADYPDGWEEEIFLKRPCATWQAQRLKRILFPELVIPPRENLPATRCTCTDDHMAKRGQPFNGKQLAALEWQHALQKAGGQRKMCAYFVSIANVPAGGNAWNFGGVGSLSRFPVLHHEMGHVLNVPDMPDEPSFPYVGPMHGIEPATGGHHIGPTWGFDPRIGLPGADPGKGKFISPRASENTLVGKPGQWRKGPMAGGGKGTEPDEPLAPFSDWSFNVMIHYLEDRVVVWNDALNAYARWNDQAGDYTTIVENDGVSLPIERDVDVYSVLVAICAPTPEEGNFVYPVIGPYVSGLIRLFDPNLPEDRIAARKAYGDGQRFDVSVRITQGGRVKTVMLAASYNPGDDPTHLRSLQTRAVNLPVRDGKVERIELLHTPAADVHGMPDKPAVLFVDNDPVTEAGE